MKIPVFFFLCAIFMAFPATALGQHYYFKNYSIESGLAQSQVHSIYQDTYGYLWIGTLGGGVSRFDGITFTNFSTKDGLADNQVLTIFEDAGRNIWFGTKKGVSRYDGTTFHPLNAGDNLSNSVFRAILEDNNSNLWFGTEKGAWKYDGKIFRHFTKKDGLVDDFIRTIHLDKKGILWFGTDNKGISRFDGTAFINFSTSDGLADNTIYSILEDRDGNLWFGTYGGVSKFEGKTFRNFNTEHGLSNNIVKSIIEDREGNLWIGTEGGGICKFDGTVFTCLTEKNGLGSNFVWALFEDREGNIWIGTYRGGLEKYSGDRFTNYSSKDGLGGDVIRSILPDSSGRLWFGTFRGGVSRYDGNSFVSFTTRDGLIHKFVLSILEDQKGNFWFGTYRGVSKYNGKTFVYFNGQDEFYGKVVREIIEDRAGNIWFGIDRGGVSRYDGKTITHFSVKDGLNDDQVQAITEDRYGNIWIGTLNGICRYDGRTFINFSEKNGLDQKYIYAIAEDKKGNIWFGAYGDGIIRYSPTNREATLEIFAVKDGLNNNNVVSLSFDNEGRLWIGTEKGLCQLDVEAYETSGRKDFRYYGREEGFSGIECISNAICRDASGTTWIGTVRGAMKYNPARDKINETEPLTHITGLRLLPGASNWLEYAKDVGRGGLPIGLSLPYNKNYLQFDFIGISLTVPGKIRYKYKLEGFDDQWVPGNESSFATYSNIPPGQYAFKVIACNNEGVWNKEATAFHFEIIPPFWQTWWFYILSAVVVIVSISTLIRIRTGNLKKRQWILEDMVKKSTEELKKEKEKVERINLELEHRVRERTSELMKSNESLHSEIAERKQVEEALRESEEKFRLVVENANDAIFIVQDDRIKFPNPMTLKMLGYPEEVLAKAPFSLLIHPEDKDKVGWFRDKGLTGDDLSHSDSLRVVNVVNEADKELWVDINSVPIHWDGKPAVLVFFRDITEKKKLEAQLFQAKKMEAIGTMAGGIAHDFNNLLMAIQGNVSLILTDIDSFHPYHGELQNIEQCVQNGANLSKQLLGFARGGRYEVKTTNLNEVIKKSSEIFSRTGKEITFHETFETNLLAVEVDRGQMEQVLMNLFVNAAHAMPGGGDIFIRTKNVTLNQNDARHIDLKPGKYVKVSITDTGAGMDEETRQRIFEPFFTTKELGRGTGLGLAVVYGIITNHGGKIQVTSKTGEGTTCEIYLLASEKEVKKEKKLPKQYKTGTGMILLVDDEALVFDVGKKLLEKLGYKVLAARSGKEAIASFKKNIDRIDLVILDMIMPGMGGRETFEQLKQINPGVKVLLSSGYSVDGEASEILKRGCNGFIQKPFHLAELSQKIKSILDSS
jgi:PAS domain S-box-containing protein